MVGPMATTVTSPRGVHVMGRGRGVTVRGVARTARVAITAIRWATAAKKGRKRSLNINKPSIGGCIET